MTATLSPGADSTDLASAAEQLFPDFAGEHAATRRLLQRFPDGRGDWRPHPRSRSLAELATHVASIPAFGVAVVATNELDVSARPPSTLVSTASELLALHDANVERLQKALETADLPALSADWVLRNGPHVLLRRPRHVMIRNAMMSHLIHHRAQLGVYFRLLGVPVPGMYGPSADDLAAQRPA